MIALLVALVALVLTIAPAAASTPARAPARVQVSATEFSYALSRAKIKAGPAIVQLANFGEDEHDLRMRRIGGTKTYAIRGVLPGEARDLRATFVPGHFTLWCSIADHRARGMQATLRVTK